MRAVGWPVSLEDGSVGVRPLRLRDARTWAEIRARNVDWLSPWEATQPGVSSVRLDWAQRQTLGTYVQMLRRMRRQARAGMALPFATTREGNFVGQVTVSTIVRGAFNSGQVGYWVDEAHAGKGVTPTALALVVDHCFGPVGLHRVEANVRPENTASRRMLDKLGFREEGVHRRYLAIDGHYRDHIAYALITEDVPEGLLHRWYGVRTSAS